MHVGTTIRNARLKMNMSQEELGKRIGVQKSAVAKYENGRVVNIKRSTLVKISNVLDIPPEKLIFDEPEILSDNVKRLVDFAKCVPEDKAEMILRVMQSIVEDD
jgi:transcriptional regulator with XRE-family HTH domain